MLTNGKKIQLKIGFFNKSLTFDIDGKNAQGQQRNGKKRRSGSGEMFHCVNNGMWTIIKKKKLWKYVRIYICIHMNVESGREKHQHLF